MLAQSALGEETIGPWTLEVAPSSALEVTSSIDPNNWLNVVNEAVSVLDAFTGFGIADDGFANFASNTTIELTFPFLIRNDAGPDLVFFDGRFFFTSINDYVISADHDSFATELALLGQQFQDSGENRSFFFGNFPGTSTADVFGIEIDLSDLGVPLGGTVGTVRIRSTSFEADPLGLGAFVSPEIFSDGFESGDVVQWSSSTP